jgi:hypothetical protein
MVPHTVIVALELVEPSNTLVSDVAVTVSALGVMTIEPKGE